MLKLSIILPCYNVEKYLERCFTSLFNQDISITEYEIVVVNDCSPDNSRDKVVELQKVHKNIVLIDHDVNKGLGAARNTGLKNARGKYIWFIDTDDFIVSNCFANILAQLESDCLDVLSFNFLKQDAVLRFFEDNTNAISLTHVMHGKEFLESNYQPSIFSSCSKIYRKDYLKEHQFYFAEGVYWEDADFVVKSIYHAEKVKYIPDHLYYYCYNELSISRTKSGKKYADMVKMGARKLEFSESIQNVSPKLAQAIRVDAEWNASVVKRIIYLSAKECKIFYSHLQSSEYLNIKSVVSSKLGKFLFKYSVLASIGCWFISPVLIQLKKIKQ